MFLWAESFVSGDYWTTEDEYTGGPVSPCCEIRRVIGPTSDALAGVYRLDWSNRAVWSPDCV